MRKNIVIGIVVSSIMVVGIGVGGTIVYLNKYAANSSSQNQSLLTSSGDGALANGVSLNSGQQLDAIPLNSQSQSSSNTGGLSVTSGQDAGGTLQGDTNTQSQSQTPTSSNAPSNQAPGPESFSQYDQYKSSENALFGDIHLGSGTVVSAGSKVSISYKGWLTDGKLFDESRPDLPLNFTVGNHEVVVGFEEGIVGMKVGGSRRIIIPPAVGYGSTGKSGIIPPNAVLVFDVTLVAAQ